MKHPKECLYVGLDIHKESHAVCMTDCFGEVLFEGRIGNDLTGFEGLDEKIQKLSLKLNKNPIVGLEDTYGNGLLLASFLKTRRYLVKTISPVLVDRQRAKNTHPEKSDALDAMGVVEVLIRDARTDKLPSYNISDSSEVAKSLRELGNDRRDLVKEQTKLKNQLHGLLHTAYGNDYNKMFKSVFSIKALNYFKESLNNANDHLSNLPFSKEILVSRIERKINRLITIKKELREIEEELKALIDKSQSEILTLNGCGAVLASQVLAEVKDIDLFKNPSSLAKYAGLSPREKSSGKSFHHQKSRAGNRRLNTAIHQIALSQIGRRGNEHAKEYFQKKIKEGKTKKQALTCLKRRLVDIIYVMLKNKESYNYQKAEVSKSNGI